MLEDAAARALAAESRLEEMEQRFTATKEARLNNQELYKIAKYEASEAVTSQGALERIIEHMEAQ